jgi:uncharacterized protein YjdB
MADCTRIGHRFLIRRVIPPGADQEKQLLHKGNTPMNALKRYSRTLFCSVGFLATALVAGCGGGDQGRDPILGLPGATLVSLAVTPATASVEIGATQQFVATASYSDGATRDVSATGAAWASATAAVATVNATSGLAAGVSANSSVITAAFGGKTASATLTVLPASLRSIVLLPANPAINIGASQQFTVMGTFSDQSYRDVSAQTTFKSATTGVATINAATGLALGMTAGSSAITATSGALNAATTLTVNSATVQSITLAPQAPSLLIGATRQLAVTAHYSDGTSADVTAASAFGSATATNVGVGGSGLLAGVAAGTSLITATFDGQRDTTIATVGAATLSSIAVTPATATVAIAGQQQFVATGTYSDKSTAIITSSVTWTSADNAIGKVSNTGAATGVSGGSTTITATSGQQTGKAVFTVTPAAAPAPVPAPVPAPAPVNLGSAASFGVLAGTSITNNSGGKTLVTGDVGASSQTTDPTQAAGYTNYKSGPILAKALADLDTAITDANGRTCDVSSADAVDLGGETLAPGVYCYAGSISITGTLNLSGPGVYIFRTALTLNTTANSIVALTNGASADNLTWVPVGATTLGANSVFKGSILGRSAAITAGDNATLLTGRVLSGAAVTLKNNPITK